MIAIFRTVCLAIPILAEGIVVSGPMVPDQDDLNKKEAAQLAVAFLRASLPWAEWHTKREWVLLPEGHVVNVEQLAEFLAAQPKPIECSARIAGERVVVQCEAPNRRSMWFQRTRYDSIEARLRALVQGIANPRIMIEAAVDTLIVSVEAYRRWIADYSFRTGINSLLEPTPESTARGANLLARFAPTQDAGASLRVQVDSAKDHLP